MKLLLENWRRYLKEDALTEKLSPEQTKQMIDIVQQVTGQGRFGGKSRTAADVARTNIAQGTTTSDLRKQGVKLPSSEHGVRPLHQQEFEAAIKEAWRQMAMPNQNFLKSITKIHWIGAYGGNNENIVKILDGFLSDRCGKRNKDEMSTFGYNGINDSMESATPIGIMMDGWITIAANDDIATEWTSLATQKDKERYASSGLPKRPGFGSLPDPEKEAELYDMYTQMFMVDAGSWENPGVEVPGNEVIVGNWSCKAVVLAPGYQEWGEKLQNILTLTEKYKLRVLDMNLQPVTYDPQPAAARMPAIYENWRKFITEMEEPITTLRIFDFDETIAHTESETRVTAPDGSTATLRDQKEFEEYMNSAAAKEGIEAFDAVDHLIDAGYQIDLSDFSIVKDPLEITLVTDVLRNFPEDSKTYILTARRGNALGPILDYLDEIGIDSSKIRPIATAGESKGNVIAKMLSNKIMPNGKSNINRIEYYEDSQKNIDDVLVKVCDNPNINDIKPLDFEMIINKVVNNGDRYNIIRIECSSQTN
jgi:hypothetical protein